MYIYASSMKQDGLFFIMTLLNPVTYMYIMKQRQPLPDIISNIYTCRTIKIIWEYLVCLFS